MTATTRTPMPHTARHSAERSAAPRLFAPAVLRATDVSVVVPVRDNQQGVDRLLASFATLEEAEKPGEVVLVDNGSAAPLTLAKAPNSPPARLFSCATPGPAAARNVGAAAAAGTWLLFMDSDCIATPSTIPGHAAALNGAVAYAGDVRALGTDNLSRYYDSQRTLVPPPREDRPAYLVTANALVWRAAFEAIGGFNEHFPSAAGEDIDLAIRLETQGDLSYALGSTVLHDFDDGLLGFARRFFRYGTGNWLLDNLHPDPAWRPAPFRPERTTRFDLAAANAQFAFMWSGYWSAKWRSQLRAVSLFAPQRQGRQALG